MNTNFLNQAYDQCFKDGKKEKDEELKNKLKLLKGKAKCINCDEEWKEHKAYKEKGHISCCPECDHRITFNDLEEIFGSF